MSTVSVCIPTIKSFSTLVDCVRSINHSSVKIEQIIIIDNSLGKLYAYADQLPDDNILVVIPEFNWGTGRSWNWFLNSCETDHIIIANDDVVFMPDTIEKMVTFADNHPDGLFFHPEQIEGEHGTGPCGNAWSLFLERKKSLDVIGTYDGLFWPAYFEDNDRAYQFMLYEQRTGIQVRYAVPDCSYYHHGSNTFKSYNERELEQHNIRFRRNAYVYFKKWGGNPAEEKFTTEFQDTSRAFVTAELKQLYGY